MADSHSLPTLFATFETRGQAEDAVDRLATAGFTAEHVGLIAPGDVEEPHYARNLAVGTGSGTVLGGAAGVVLGAVAVGAIPGVGTVVAAGAILPIAVLAFTGAAAGGTLGGMFSLAASQDQGLYFMQEVQGGRTLVTVTSDRVEEARAGLEAAGAMEVADVGRSETADKLAPTEEAPAADEVPAAGERVPGSPAGG